jgi:hypothetical protein
VCRCVSSLVKAFLRRCMWQQLLLQAAQCGAGASGVRCACLCRQGVKKVMHAAAGAPAGGSVECYRQHRAWRRRCTDASVWRQLLCIQNKVLLDSCYIPLLPARYQCYMVCCMHHYYELLLAASEEKACITRIVICPPHQDASPLTPALHTVLL